MLIIEMNRCLSVNLFSFGNFLISGMLTIDVYGKYGFIKIDFFQKFSIGSYAQIFTGDYLTVEALDFLKPRKTV